MRQHDTLGLFAKHWTAARVKTRLGGDIGQSAANRIYRSFLKVAADRWRSVADRRIVAFWPPDRLADFQELFGADWQFVPQVSGDLGARMKNFFADQLKDFRSRVVLIGSDSPTLPPATVRRAFDALGHSDTVLGPASDGGYYLVGATKSVPPIFDNVDWSQPTVWRQTIESLQHAGRLFATLDEWFDVDDLNDLRRLRRELKEQRPNDASLLELSDLVEACFGK